ncbi:OB-fold nucleic acid binding domain-containing protein [Jatrophihabitans endophyticus]|uniref:OB-fold nucleic acid binding domain-containing protein n=1 Tax=Jatrophihabitans endophyticus TaxID=1206085 RepID=UPI0019EA336A|nr:OB-fold nucleic acid binding domain-containing protein [Jatrophihabitans endophyticus]
MGKKSLLQRLTASAENLDAADLQEAVEVRSCMPMCDTRRGHQVKVVGRLRSVTYTPSETVPTLEAELFDGSDSLDLVWLGQRRIAGVEPGRRIVARGRVGVHNDRLAIYNPWYELLPAGAP